MTDKALDPAQQSVFIPVYTEPNVRMSYANDDIDMEQMYLNCWPQVTTNDITGSTSVSVVKRPGSAVLAANTLSPKICSYSSRVASQTTGDDMQCLVNTTITQLYDVYVAAFFDVNNSKIYFIQYRPKAGTTTKIGEITSCNVNDQVFITEFVNSDTLLPAIAISYQKADQSSSTMIFAVTTAGVFTAAMTTITQPTNPVTGGAEIMTGPMQFMNGHLYIMAISGYIYNCSLTSAGNPDAATWTATASVVASQYPDRGVGIYRYKHHLVSFGQDSIEFWNDANNPAPGSPLERTDQAFIKFGCYNAKLVINVDDVLYWIAYSSAGTYGMWKMDGYTPVKISTNREDIRMLTTYSGTRKGHHTIDVVNLLGRRHIMLNGVYQRYMLALVPDVDVRSLASDDVLYRTFVASYTNRALMYSVEDKTWWGFCSGTDTTPPANGNYTTCFLPAQAYPTVAQTGQGTQYCFRRQQTDSIGAAAGAIIDSTFPFTFVTQPTAGSAQDVGFTVTTGPIPTIMQTNVYRFQSAKRNRFSRVAVLMDPPPAQTYTAGVYVGYSLFGLADDGTIVWGKARRMLAGTNAGYRFSVNNLGMGRSITLSILTNNKEPLHVYGFEVTLTPGTH